MNRDILNYLVKMKRASDQYRRRLYICPQLPIRLWIEPTNRCNLRCIMCPNSNPPAGTQYGNMDMGLYRKLIDEASEFAIDINLFARGESLLCDEIFEMITYANSKGLRTRLETNATFLDTDMSRRLIDAGLNYLSFSIDGYTKQVYEKVRLNADFKDTLRNIQGFLKTKKESGSKRPFVLIQIIEVSLVKNNSGGKAKRDFKKMFKRLPINGFKFVTPHRFGGIIDKEITGTDYAYMSNKGLLRHIIRMRYSPCPYPWYGMSIYYDGSVLPCCLSFFDNYIIGDANTQSLKEIWNGSPMVTLREKIARCEYEQISMCKECDFLYQRSIAGFSIKSAKDAIIFMREILHD